MAPLNYKFQIPSYWEANSGLGFGLEYGILSFKNAREFIIPIEFAKEFKVPFPNTLVVNEIMNKSINNTNLFSKLS